MGSGQIPILCAPFLVLITRADIAANFYSAIHNSSFLINLFNTNSKLFLNIFKV